MCFIKLEDCSCFRSPPITMKIYMSWTILQSSSLIGPQTISHQSCWSKTDGNTWSLELQFKEAISFNSTCVRQVVNRSNGIVHSEAFVHLEFTLRLTAPILLFTQKLAFDNRSTKGRPPAVISRGSLVLYNQCSSWGRPLMGYSSLILFYSCGVI